MLVLAIIAVLFVSGLWLTVLTGRGLGEKQFEVGLFTSAFALRMAAVMTIYTFGFVSVLGDEDSMLWLFGTMLTERWEGLSLGNIMADAWDYMKEREHRGYFVFLGLVFHALGFTSRIVAASMSAWIGAMTVVLTYRLTTVLFGARPARIAGGLACIMPSLIIWSSQTVKEPFVVYFELLVLYLAIRLRERFTLGAVLAICLSVLALATLRFYAAYIVVGGVAVGLAVNRGARGRIAMLLVAAVLVPVASYSGFAGRHSDVYEKYADVDAINYLRHDFSKGPTGAGSGIAAVEDVGTADGFAKAYVVGVASIMLAPFPWQFLTGSLRMLLTLPDTLLWYYLVWKGLIPGIRAALEDVRKVFPILVFCVVIGSIYSIMYTNAGLIYRQRTQLLPYLLAFIGLGLTRRSELARRGGAAVAAVRRDWRAPEAGGVRGGS